MYSTDIEETQWQVIKKILNLQERKRKYNLREIWDAIFYLVKTGCQWRMLPVHFPPWELLLNNLREKVRIQKGQNAEASVGIMDSQSVRWGDNRSLNGIDGNKKVKGIKRHVVVDKNGFLIAVMVTIACVHDGKAAYLLARCLKELCWSNGFKPIGKRWVVERTFSWFDNYRRLCETTKSRSIRQRRWSNLLR